jgi:DeoR/GlpR family transcriptional regulator of sugar metabolism
MLAIERRSEILTKLQQEGKVLVNDLSKLYQVTEETIRRDLEKLEVEGIVRKTYGGAVLVETLNVDLPYYVRKQTNVQSKENIASKIAELIQDGDHIMLDASSTAVYVIKRIKQLKNITIITNSIEILLELADVTGWKVFSTGGTMKEGALALIGHQAEEMIDHFHVDKAIISCKGIDQEFGITDSNEPDVEIKRHMVKAAKQVILAVDSSKFDKISFVRMGAFDQVNTIVTDSVPQQTWIDHMEQYDVTILY